MGVNLQPLVEFGARRLVLERLRRLSIPSCRFLLVCKLTPLILPSRSLFFMMDAQSLDFLPVALPAPPPY